MAKEYIEREALRKKIFPYEGIDKAKYAINAKAVEAAINGTPAADVVEVVRCKDCKHWRYETAERIEHYECNIFCGAYGRGYPTDADDFCSYGEREERG